MSGEPTSRAGAAYRCTDGVAPGEIARRLRVAPKSVYQWRRAWKAGGEMALSSKGPLGRRCWLSPRSQAKLAVMLDQGPAAHGWDEDQVWTGARVARLIGRTFHVSYSVSEATRLMRRLGFTPQVPARRAAERDDPAVAVRSRQPMVMDPVWPWQDRRSRRGAGDDHGHERYGTLPP